MNDERPRLRRVKVLVAGMNTGTDNRFARILKMYPNVEVLHESGDPTGTCNPNGDAALIALSQISHGKFYTVKDTYKALGKRVFIVRNGFTEIKQQFEDWLDQKTNEIEGLATQEAPKPRETAMSHAFKQALQKPEPQTPPPCPDCARQSAAGALNAVSETGEMDKQFHYERGKQGHQRRHYRQKIELARTHDAQWKRMGFDAGEAYREVSGR